MTDPDPRAELAAANNANWYQMLFEVQGLRYQRTAQYFRAIDDPPAYHSRTRLLAPALSANAISVIARESSHRDFGIKDSFGSLDLDRFGIVELFQATWIWHERPAQPVDGWIRIGSSADLEAWEWAWRAGGSPTDRRQFPSAILDRAEVAVFGRRSDSGFDAGVIANVSADCFGMSNVFGSAAVGPASALCADFGGERPVVGYERGDDLTEARRVGFEAVGRLRVCGRPS